MTPSQSHLKLLLRIEARLLKMRRLYSDARTFSGHHRKELLSVSSIELDNLIVGAFRCFIIGSLSAARTASGKRISATSCFQSEGEIGSFILKTINPVKHVKMGSPQSVCRLDEPRVRHPRDVRKVITVAGASNVSAFDTAMALSTTVFDTMPTVRNFYAHRNHDTWQKFKKKAQSAGVFGVKRPEDYLNSFVQGSPVTIFEDWLDDLEIFFEYALQ